MKRSVAVMLALALLLGAFAPKVEADAPQLAITADDIAWEQCAAAVEGRELGTASREALLYLLGLQNERPAQWRTPPLGEEVRHFRIAFKRPVAAGTICSSYVDDTGMVAVLRPDAEWPGDVSDDAHWRTLPDGDTKTLATGTQVRALRLTHKSFNLPWVNKKRESVAPFVLLLKGRFWSPAQLGQQEWTENEWTGYWPIDLPVSGVVLFPAPRAEAALSAAPAEIETHPLALDAKEWRTLNVPIRAGGALIRRLPDDTRTTALRIAASDYGPRGRHRAAPRVVPLVALKEEQPAPTSFVPAPPFDFQYEMPMDGFIAIRIRDDEGREIRRLIAEVERQRGRVTDFWDLRNDAGSYVRPGTYHWRAIARPPLRLTYEMTVYNAGTPPWMAPVPGGGWWMADHSPPVSICAAGDTIFMGALGAEFGQALIATDLEGKKVWGSRHQNAQRLVSDGRYGYIVNNGELLRIDPKRDFEIKKLLTFRYTPEIPGHARGYYVAEKSAVAARPGVLCIGYDAPETAWIQSSFQAKHVDLSRCFPPPIKENTHDTAYTPSERILATFLTFRSSISAYMGDTVDKGPFANMVLLTLKREMPVGSVLVPDPSVNVYALRPGRKLPARFRQDAGPAAGPGFGELAMDDPAMADVGGIDARFDREDWVQLDVPEDLKPTKAIAGRHEAHRGRASVTGRATVAVPREGFKTRVLAFTAPRMRQLPLALVLNRRYRNATRDARMVMLEGGRTAFGGWHTRRRAETPISYGKPATAGYVWDKPARVRGFALVGPMPWAGLAVDVWGGPADAEIDKAEFAKSEHWRQVMIHHQTRNHVKFNWHTPRMLTGDFGETLQLRAIRVRIVEPPRPPGQAAPRDPAGGFGGLVCFQPIGKDPKLPENYAQRITLVDLPAENGEAKIRRHHRLEAVSGLAFAPDGVLYAACREGIVRVDGLTADRISTEVIVPRDKAGAVTAMTADAEGLLYTIDPVEKIVRVFDPGAGKQMRTIGTPGGVVAGPWDPTRFSKPVSLDIDRNGKLWVVEQYFQPKRISRWTREGKHEKDFMGPTHYGGGGYIDPGDRSIVNHYGMKFRIDWARRSWRLDSRLVAMGARGMYMPDRVVYLNGHRYLVGDHPVTLFGDDGPLMDICVERDGMAMPLVAAGVLSGWTALTRNPEIEAAFGKLEADKTSFIWIDRNRDSSPQVGEVQIAEGAMLAHSSAVGEDLSLNFRGHEAGWRLRPTRIREDGLPLYDLGKIERVPGLTNRAMVTREGETFVMGHRMLAADGSLKWTYPDNYMSVQMSNKTPWGFYSRPPGVLCGGLRPIGHFEVGDEHLFCVTGNNGDYYAFTDDGLLAAAIVGGPVGYGRRFFSTPDCRPGKTDLTDLRKTVEDFYGHICRAEDGKIYFVVGKNHVTLVRADGLERMQRLSGTFEVTQEDIKRTMQWRTEKARIERAMRRPPIYTVPYMAQRPNIDGETQVDWPRAEPMEIHIVKDHQGNTQLSYTGRLAFDKENLYIGATAVESSPMKNSGADIKNVFQYGDGLDFHIGLNPKADPDRREAVPGDIRIVITRMKDRPVVVLYRYEVEGKRLGGQPALYTSPVGRTEIDEVVEIVDATVRFAVSPDGSKGGWSVEAAIPWKAIGADPLGRTITMRGDIGVLESDPNGVTTVARHYWANKSNVVMSDLPSEARVIPSLWGELRFVVPELSREMLREDKLEGDPLLQDLRP